MNNTPHGIKQKPGRQLKEQRPVQWWKIKIINISITQINKIPIMFDKRRANPNTDQWEATMLIRYFW